MIPMVPMIFQNLRELKNPVGSVALRGGVGLQEATGGGVVHLAAGLAARLASSPNATNTNTNTTQVTTAVVVGWVADAALAYE